MRERRIVTIPGDNIGPELLEAALIVLEAVQQAERDFRLNFESITAGAAHYTAHGTAISPDSIEACRAADSVLKAVQDIIVEESGGDVFDQEVVETLRSWQHEPATKNGVRVKVRLQKRFTFRQGN